MTKGAHIRIRVATRDRLIETGVEEELTVSELSDRILTGYLDAWEQEREEQEEQEAEAEDVDEDENEEPYDHCPCPHCGELVSRDDDTCPHCGEEIDEDE